MKGLTRSQLASMADLLLAALVVLALVAVPLLVRFTPVEQFFPYKVMLLFVLAAGVLLVGSAVFVLKRRVRITISPGLAGLAGLAVASLLSGVFGDAPLADGLVGRIGVFWAVFGVYLVGSSRPAQVGQFVRYGLTTVAAVAALLAVLAYSGVLTEFFPEGTVVGRFTPMGSMEVLLVVLVGLLPLALEQTRPSRTNKEGLSQEQRVVRLLSVLAALVIVGGVVVGAISVFSPTASGASPQMPLGIGWQTAVETMKERPIFGVGPGGYPSAYTRFRPLVTNQTSVWDQRFLQAPNELLQAFTTGGVVGLSAVLFLVWQLWRMLAEGLRRGAPRGVTVALGLMVVSLAFQPLSVVSAVVLVGLMVVLALELKLLPVDPATPSSVYDTRVDLVTLREGVVQIERQPRGEAGALQQELPRSRPSGSGMLAWGLVAISAVVFGVATFFVSRAWLAEVHYQRGIAAISANDGTAAYNNLQRAVQLNPWSDIYHRQYAEVNLQVANALAASQSLSDDDRANIPRLIQQAIREGKIATEIAPEGVLNWEALGRIYRSLINVADGAQDWTVISYTEAIRRDPVNPQLRLELGSIHYSLEEWDQAIRHFQATVSLKPDFANGYFNLGLAYERDGQIQEAVRALESAVRLLAPTSADYEQATTKLGELRDQLEQAAPSPAVEGEAGEEGELTEPEPLPTLVPGIERVELGEEEAPPVTPAPEGGSPTPTAAP